MPTEAFLSLQDKDLFQDKTNKFNSTSTSGRVMKPSLSFFYWTDLATVDFLKKINNATHYPLPSTQAMKLF